MKGIIYLVPAIFLLFFCTSKSEKPESGAEKKLPTIKIESKAFENNDTIPTMYTCDGENISPSLSWEKIPEEVEEIVIICDDPDAPMGTWVHWVIYNIPSEVDSLPEDIENKTVIQDSIFQGTNSSNKPGYTGPCPPDEPAHHYHFKIYGLKSGIDAKPGLSKSEILEKMKGKIAAKGEIVGLYKRKK